MPDIGGVAQPSILSELATRATCSDRPLRACSSMVAANRSPAISAGTRVRARPRAERTLAATVARPVDRPAVRVLLVSRQRAPRTRCCSRPWLQPRRRRPPAREVQRQRSGRSPPALGGLPQCRRSPAAMSGPVTRIPVHPLGRRCSMAARKPHASVWPSSPPPSVHTTAGPRLPRRAGRRCPGSLGGGRRLGSNR